MKMKRQEQALIGIVNDLSATMAHNEEHFVTPAEFYNLVFSPDELRMIAQLRPRLKAEERYTSVRVSFGGGRVMSFAPRSVPQRFAINDCQLQNEAPSELVDRLLAWYERRVTVGNMAAAFRDYCFALIGHCPTPAHMYRLFPNSTILFGVLKNEEVELATHSNPRDAAIVPREFQSVREAATQAAVMMEVMDLVHTMKKPRPAERSNQFRIDLPDEREHLGVNYAVPGYPDVPGRFVTPL